MTGLLEAHAKEFATICHGALGQTRKYNHAPYITHPAAVVEIVRSVDHTEEMLAAAWLHDTVEDTQLSLDTILEYFGSHVALLVDMLTDPSRPEDGNRAERRAIDRIHTSAASPEAKTIKLADLIDNTRTIVSNDPKFAEVYLQEKALLLRVLKEGDSDLWHRAFNQVVDGIEHLDQLRIDRGKPIKPRTWPEGLQVISGNLKFQYFSHGDTL